MSLKRKLLTWGSALMLGWGSLTSNLGENQALAETNTKKVPAHCEQVTKKHKTKLEGEYFGLKDGCLDNFQKNQEDNFECIDDFLKEYPEDTCGRTKLYNDSIEALLKNIHTKNKPLKSKIRSSLKREGILDYKKQLDELVDAANLTKGKIKRAEKVFNHLNPIAQRKSIKRVESWKNYLNYLRIEATVVADLALYLREKPSVTSTGRIDPERVKGIVRSYSALNNLAALKLHLSNSDWYMAVNDFRLWKKDHAKVYQRFLTILNTSLDNASFKTGEGNAWKSIVYSDSQGNWKKGWATREFSQEWGDNGENFYEKIETIDDAIKEVGKIKLIENNKYPMLDGVCNKTIKNDPDCEEIDSDKPNPNRKKNYYKILKDFKQMVEQKYAKQYKPNKQYSCEETRQALEGPYSGIFKILGCSGNDLITKATNSSFGRLYGTIHKGNTYHLKLLKKERLGVTYQIKENGKKVKCRVNFCKPLN